mmetsp:Transcript_24700/g.72285  ORF Transcript_24700/g.72285 Transcript_24700/m.72285 type:complete len:207 (+) Transcript_24700:1336-1956(+)
MTPDVVLVLASQMSCRRASSMRNFISEAEPSSQSFRSKMPSHPPVESSSFFSSPSAASSLSSFCTAAATSLSSLLALKASMARSTSDTSCFCFCVGGLLLAAASAAAPPPSSFSALDLTAAYTSAAAYRSDRYPCNSDRDDVTDDGGDDAYGEATVRCSPRHVEEEAGPASLPPPEVDSGLRRRESEANSGRGTGQPCRSCILSVP